MRVLVMVKANKESEAGKMPSERLVTEMGMFNDELLKAGILVAAEGLHPSSKGKRLRYTNGKVTVVDGPFVETKELVAGYWLWKVKSMDEAVAWIKRCPNPDNTDGEIELRPIFEMEDFVALAPELRAQEERQRAQVEQLNKGTKK